MHLQPASPSARPGPPPPTLKGASEESPAGRAARAIGELSRPGPALFRLISAYLIISAGRKVALVLGEAP